MPGPGAYWIGEEEKQEVLERGHVNRYGDLNDPKFKQKVLTFEKEFAEYCGAKHYVATSSGTSTLFISMKTIGIQPGNEIIIKRFRKP